MSTNPNPGQQPDANNSYGGYGGYRPSNPSDDPYGTPPTPTPRNPQQGGATGTGTPQNDPGYVYGQQGQQYAPGQQQQQFYGQPGQNAYVPPSSVSGSKSYHQSATDEQSKRAAFLSYLGLCFTGLFFFFTGRRNSFVRFHAAQSIVLFAPLVVVYLVVRIFLIIPLIGFLLAPILGCLSSLIVIATALLWIFLMVQSYRGANIRLPIVSDYADAFMARFSKGRTI